MQSHVLNDMLPFASDGRECLTKGDKRGAIFDVGVVEQERTSRRRLIVVNLIVVNFRRHERHRRDDSLLRVMRNMGGVIAADESRAKFAAEAAGDDVATTWTIELRSNVVISALLDAPSARSGAASDRVFRATKMNK